MTAIYDLRATHKNKYGLTNNELIVAAKSDEKVREDLIREIDYYLEHSVPGSKLEIKVERTH